MQIADQKVVTLNYTLKDDNGNVLDEARDGSFLYLHGAANIIPGLENALTGKQVGDTLLVAVEPSDGYGERSDEMRQSVPRDMFPEDAEIAAGVQFHAQSPDGHAMVVTVVEVENDTVVVDGNHPLAGVRLNFDVEIMGIRDASDDEIAHGHVHTPGDHHH